MGQNKSGLTGWCAATVLASAFLLFQVQPMVSKMILPWFGGSPAVWTTCMLFFQVFLLVGYLYAHLLDRLPSTRWQGIIHVTLLLAALCVLPIVPDPIWKPADSSDPQWRILALLAASVGLPYLLLASSAPLVQAWYSRAFEGRSPYRFYAISNFGSLAALLSYPFLIEPAFAIPAQGTLWSSGFCAYAVLGGGLALAVARWNLPAVAANVANNAAAQAADRLTAWRLFIWLALPAFGSLGLLAVTNQICQDVAVVPFFWVVPLSLYLITFILCFDSAFWYRRNLFGMATLVVLMMIGGILFRDRVQPMVDPFKPLLERIGVGSEIPEFLDSITMETTLYLSALFCICMLCHGELVRNKPTPRHLTLFYLFISAGGALGGMFVALVCPKVFSQYVESPIFLVGGGLLALIVLLSSWWKRERRWSLWWQAFVGLAVLVVRNMKRRVWRRGSAEDQTEGDQIAREQAELIRIGKLARAVRQGRPWYTLWSLLVPIVMLAGLITLADVLDISRLKNETSNRETLVSRRSFYGVLRVKEYGQGTVDERRNLYNGRILHGVQLLEADRRREPTTYYSEASGIGLTLTCLGTDRPLRVATVGLGTGTIAAYGRPGDYYCFYEINPDVIDIAGKYFSFLSDSPADVHVEEGDARLSMERQPPQHYDVIALDAFSGDAIPAHLLTIEAVAVYLKHLNPDGVLAVHTSNRHLDLVPIVALLAAHYQMQVVSVNAEDGGGVADSSSEWLLVTHNAPFLGLPDVAGASEPVDQPGSKIRVWTDQFSNLFQILRAWHDDES